MYFTCILHTSKRRGVADQAIFCGNSNITLGKIYGWFSVKDEKCCPKKKFFPFFMYHSVHTQCTAPSGVLYSFYNTLFILNVQLQMLYLYHSIATQCTALSTLCTVPLVNVQHKVLYLNCTSAILIFSLGISASFTRFADLASLI